MKLGIVTGIQSESDCLSGIAELGDVVIRCSAARPDYAHQCASELVDLGCDALLSFGIAGGLSPEVSAGQVILSSSVVLPNGESVHTDSGWRQRLVDKLSTDNPVVIDVTSGSETIVADISEKNVLHRNTKGIAVDMESHRVAMVAREHTLPFLVIRAVSDAHNQSIPKSALGVIDVTGRPGYVKVMSEILRRPADIPKLIRLSGDTRQALSNLRRVALVGAPLFQLA